MSKRAKIIIWSIISIILIGVLFLFLFRDGNNSISFFGNGSVSGSYKDSNLYSVGDMKANADEIKSIELNWISGTVKVMPHDGNQIQISETVYGGSDSPDEDSSMRYLVKNGKLIVQFTKPYNFLQRMFAKSVKKDLLVLIPQTEYELNNFTLNTVNSDNSIASLKSYDFELNNVSGEIELMDINITSELKIENVSGKVSVENISANELKIDTVSGNVTLDNGIINKLSFDTVSGKLNSRGDIKSINSDTVSGDLHIVSTTALNDISFDSVSGDFYLEMPESSGFTVEFDSVSGDFNSDFSLKSSGKEKIYGNGLAKYEFDSVSGSVTVNQNISSVNRNDFDDTVISSENNPESFVEGSTESNAESNTESSNESIAANSVTG